MLLECWQIKEVTWAGRFTKYDWTQQLELVFDHLCMPGKGPRLQRGRQLGRQRPRAKQQLMR